MGCRGGPHAGVIVCHHGGNNCHPHRGGLKLPQEVFEQGVVKVNWQGEFSRASSEPLLRCMSRCVVNAMHS